jgi:hypothetical protein
MPTVQIPGLEIDEQATINRLLEQLDAKATRNHLRGCYYDGKHAIRQLGAVVPPQYYRMGIVLGWSAKAVDTLNRRCNLDRFVWPDGDLDSIGFADVFDSNHLGVRISSAGASSLLYGVSFLINTRGDVSNGEPASLITVKSARDATGDWNWRTWRLDNLLSVTGRDEAGVTGLVLYLDGLTIMADKDGLGRWTVNRQPHSFGVPAEPLVYRPREDRPFGTSRISRPVMSLHDQALRTVIRMEGHADVYSFPEMWLLGADQSIFKNSDGTQKAAWQVMLGRIKAIPDNDEGDAANARADVKQFQASSPQPHIDQLKQQAMLFSGETSIPLTSLGVSDMSNPTSADSYIASREDLIAEAEGTTDDWSPALRRAMIRGLAIQNGLDKVPDEWKTIQPKWRSPLYLSRAAAADAGAKQLAVVPWLAETEVGLELLGLDDQQVQRAMAEKRRQRGAGVLAGITAAAAQANAQTATTVNPGADTGRPA